MIKSIEELKAIKDKYLPVINLRLDHRPASEQRHLLVCAGTACTSSASQEIIKELDRQIKEHKLTGKAKVFKTGCFGFCQQGPIVVVQPDNIFYCRVKKENVKDLVEKHIIGGRVLEELLFKEPDSGELQRRMEDIRFFHNQQRVVLRNCGVINPEDINEYIARDGYAALADILNHRSRAEVIDQVINSVLRGRGGGGFPTGKKWQIAARQEVNPKYIVCNADEGDPGAFMDRSILEGDPHAILEGMSIGAYAVGAEQGYIYVRAEYPIAVDRLEIAIGQARQMGLLGKNILGSGFNFDIDIKLGAGAFVCGEETALLHSCMGARGEPRPRPPYPAQEGLWGKPTVINNVETFANVTVVFQKGWQWFVGRGTAKSSGTKVFSLAGKIKNTGLIEVPMGSTLRSIIFDTGGGIPDGHRYKAVQTGGPSGGCIPEEYLDILVDYDSLAKVGSIMGSGGLIVMDDRDCMVDIARFYVEFAQDESCGRCTPCRVGTKRLLEILQRITKGEGEMEDLRLLEELSQDIKVASLCGLGQTAPNPVLSTLRFFRDEYIAHIRDKHCPAGVCKDLLHYLVLEDQCIACGICAKACPVDAISGERKKPPYKIDPEKCIRCGACMEKCPKDVIIRGSIPGFKAAAGQVPGGGRGGINEEGNLENSDFAGIRERGDKHAAGSGVHAGSGH
ncbi:Respiratory-chain NADH dehydrogenase domain 51 kDa subunit [Desulfofarcimen acetoxidans DSM 771]|uniref:Respiratory-chain NADH dehydrogenase domain 51 kDa subunit n=1 Tax=Desulfofarcimen acetoxidans (strain ATCC 49208 / DSM 771 / KCTC 5769 / VKM B-1644 / 5575) TaxID=485916 RepID=C8VXD8_DESAS|nr:NADH-ubiquinone oxidoreductase-F iron-sulfur binding region domain-containing protein [Desulfofarcimen acetoxidans]ACV64534.1 Respiratory-chain NADH dehydrogenase domain 51 kDa subunit [Desulfofarcimen acetoxidans DSM 771]